MHNKRHCAALCLYFFPTMKKIHFFLIASLTVFSLGLASCSKDDASDQDAIASEEPDLPVVGFDENGASLFLFSVGEGVLVRFSRGNLQYQAASNVWRFAEHQYDCAGLDNEQISATYNGWIDLFGWGTSGWNSGANVYQPWSVSTDNTDYYVGGSSQGGLTGMYAEADWAWHNAIQNGGNQPHQWRVLTEEEWRYLLEERPDATLKCGAASIGGKNGMVILPDNWVLPQGLTFSPDWSGWSTNAYTKQQWSRMEAAGAVFLPAAGSRYGTLVGDVLYEGVYWSSSADDDSYVCVVRHEGYDFTPVGYDGRQNGHSASGKRYRINV